jgi:hypothetical protein
MAARIVLQGFVGRGQGFASGWLGEDPLFSNLLGVQLHAGSINVFVSDTSGIHRSLFPHDQWMRADQIRVQGYLHARACTLAGYDAFILRTEHPGPAYRGPTPIPQPNTMFEIVAGSFIPALTFGGPVEVAFDPDPSQLRKLSVARLATLTVIVGYCGSGKTWLLDQKRIEHPAGVFMDEGFLSPGNPRDLELKAHILRGLAEGRDCFITLMDCGHPANKEALEREIEGTVPEAKIKWIFFQNDVARANQNCSRDPKRQDPLGNIAQNNMWAAVFSIPPEAELRPIFELPDPKQESPT